MAFIQLRNYFAEKTTRIKDEWKRFQQSNQDPILTQEALSDSDIRRMYFDPQARLTEKDARSALDSEFQRLRTHFEESNSSRSEPFQYSTPRTEPFPENRLPATNIRSVPKRYHTGATITATDFLPETGFQAHPLIVKIISSQYPEYNQFLHRYVRPLGTTDAVFSDFNRTQIPSDPIDPDRKEHVLKHVFKFLHAEPYLPVHFVDTQYAKLPLNTGTGYNNRTSYKTRAHAKYSHPPEFENMQTKKGYYINALLEKARIIIHKIKDSGLPFDFNIDDHSPDQSYEKLLQYINNFIDDHPTLLFTLSTGLNLTNAFPAL
jgi:hypothetical protein